MWPTSIERWLYRVSMRFRSLFLGNTLDRDLDEELQYHVERLAETNRARGLSPDAARRAALLAIGGIAQRKEECRDARRVRPLDDLGRDLRYGLRTLSRSPTFSAVAILSLALGLGANTAIFQLIDAVRLRPLPVPEPRELAAIRDHEPRLAAWRLQWPLRGDHLPAVGANPGAAGAVQRGAGLGPRLVRPGGTRRLALCREWPMGQRRLLHGAGRAAGNWTAIHRR